MPPDAPPPDVAAAADKVQAWLNQQTATPKTREEIDKMTPAARLDYARKFDQSKMPPNPHDQALAALQKPR
jgi:hypothetical protein